MDLSSRLLVMHMPSYRPPQQRGERNDVPEITCQSAKMPRFYIDLNKNDG